jgi:CubicO group peptidase (beta-lactamase class C family)
VYQPEERPRGPLALPFLDGEVRADIIEVGGGYLPTRASASAGGGAGCIAANSAALARWGYLLFGGDLISEESLLAMTTFNADRYGLGVFDQSIFFPQLGVDAVGNGGWDPGGYSASLSVLPKRGLVIAVLTNRDGAPATYVFPVAQELASILEA